MPFAIFLFPLFNAIEIYTEDFSKTKKRIPFPILTFKKMCSLLSIIESSRVYVVYNTQTSFACICFDDDKALCKNHRTNTHSVREEKLIVDIGSE